MAEESIFAPRWAVERRNALVGDVFRETKDVGLLYSDCLNLAFARYIAAHEQPPVDPLLIEARKVICENYGNTRMHDGSLMFGDGPRRVEDVRAGVGDEYWEMRVVIAALRRGQELASLTTTEGGK